MKNTEEWARDQLEKFDRKVGAELAVLGNGIPYIPKDNHYDDMGEKDITWWTNGFWPGILWQLYNYNQKEEYLRTARAIEKRLDDALTEFDGLDHDVGFMWTLTAIADYKLTQNKRSYTRALHAATILAGRYNPYGHFVKAWNPENGLNRNGWVIIDSLMNMSLLYWAESVTKDPKFSYIAQTHTKKVMTNNLRKDGSVNHICIFDPETGKLLETKGGQGYAVGSAWSRGQAWAIYGFTNNYKHTKNADFLNAAKQSANYFIANIDETDYIPLVDFRAPKEPIEIDTTAATIAAAGLLDLSEILPPMEESLYKRAALHILKAISEKYVDTSLDTMGIVTHGSVNYVTDKANEQPIIYADYFYVEALLKLLNKKLVLW